MTAKIAPSAVVEEGATVGDGTVVWDLTQVRAGASVGAGCTIGRNVFIDVGVTIGDRCKVQNNALVYAPATIGDGVFIGPAVILTNDRNPRAIAADDTPKGPAEWTAEGVAVGEAASIGAGAVVLAGVSIGPWALVAAGAVVAGDVAPYALVAGVPARRIGWVGPSGARLEVDGDVLRCPMTGQAFVERAGALEPAP